jgi:hypothetical protein
VVIRVSLTIYPNNNLVDGGNGMCTNGSRLSCAAWLGPQPGDGQRHYGYAGPSRLTLGTAAAATGFPTGYQTGKRHGGTAHPTSILNRGTTVVYASGRPQSIQGIRRNGNTTYANLILAKPRNYTRRYRVDFVGFSRR